MAEMDLRHSAMSNALFPLSPERTNQQRPQHSRESSVSDQVNKFNTMASMTRTAERGVNDAALKRAMMAREEALSEARKYRNENESLRATEAEMRRHRDEAAQNKKEVKIISERYENLVEQFMAEKENHSKDRAKLDEYREKYARTRETHDTIQKTWEKELRGARKAQKDSFKIQSRLVQVQDELRSAKNTITLMKVNVEEEKERTRAREEEAFSARCELVNVQEELTNAKEKIKLVEQERDALRTIARNEEILRIAAEGRLPLPCSPQKQMRPEQFSPGFISSAASEEELEELKWKMQYERQRVERAYDLIDFMQAECQFQCCGCRIAGSVAGHSQGEVLATIEHEHPDLSLNSCNSADSNLQQEKQEEKSQDSSIGETQQVEPEAEEDTTTIFIPSEGIFRTVASPTKRVYHLPQKRPIEEVSSSRPTSSAANLSFHSRTPSIDPPAPAIQHQINTSLLSLMQEQSPLSAHQNEHAIEDDEDEENDGEDNTQGEREPESPSPHKKWQTISTTTRIPLKPDENTPLANKTAFSHGYYSVSNINFNVTSNTDPQALQGGDENAVATPSSSAIIGTMTKEQALEQIKLRRGRAQSIAQGTLTPRKKMCEGVGSYERRDISAPAAVTLKGFGSASRAPKSAPPNRTKFGMS